MSISANGSPDFHLLAEQIYAAAEDAALWPQVLDQLAGVVHGRGTGLIANFVRSDTRDVVVTTQMEPEKVSAYAEHYAAMNVWAPRMDKVFSAGEVGFSDRAIADSELRGTEFYNDWLKPCDFAYSMGVVLPLPGQSPALLTTMRSAREGPFSEADGRALAALLPHLARALRLHSRLSSLRVSAQSMELALDAADYAVIGLDADGIILFCNRRAESVLNLQKGLGVRNGRLFAEPPSSDAVLQGILRKLAASPGGSGPDSLLLPRSAGQPPLCLSFVPFAAPALSFVPKLATLVFVYDPARTPAARVGLLRKLFGLSPTEARIAAMLAAGETLAEAAEELRMSFETARFHLRTIFRKTGVNRQAALIRLVLGLPGDASPR